MLAMMIEPRIEEIFELAKKEVRKNHVSDLLGAGVVLTGGAAQLDGLIEFASQALQAPVRLGLPKGLHGASATLGNPASATAVGLLLHAQRLNQARRRQNGSVFHRLRNLLGGKGWAA